MATKFVEIPLHPDPSYIKLAEYEKNFPLTYWRQIFKDYWIISVYASLVKVNSHFPPKRKKVDPSFSHKL